MMLWIIVGVLEAVSLACVYHLWTRRPAAPLGRRLVWTVVTLVPTVGALLYGALYQPPSIQSESEQARENRDASYGHHH